ncbi:MAG: TetR/AcrR family transcriptional regulator [Hyphomonadaceae bacterium]
MTKTSRDAVAEAAILLFAQRGFRETSVGDIEEAAGLTRRAGGFYRHFKSKEAVLIESVRAMARAMTAEIRLAEILAQGNVKRELLFIAEHLLAHAAQHRDLRLLLQREAHKLPALRAVLRRANMTLARQDIVPWTAHALRRAGLKENATTFAFLVFGPVLLYLVSIDRGQPAFGLAEKDALDAWAAHWSKTLRPRRRRSAG